MLYRYIGAGDDPPRSIVFMGRVPFTRDGAPVEVDDPAIAAKLAGNPSFVAVDTPIAYAPALDLPDDLAALRDALEAKGVRVDGRWGVGRLKQELARV